MVAIIDYKIGNLGSINNMLKELELDVVVTSDINVIKGASHLILPGVGAYNEGMGRLNESGLIPTLNNLVLENKIPILGICLGMQLMAKKSEEGNLSGLGWIDAEVVKFDLSGSSFKSPHMGWNYVLPAKESGLFSLGERSRFYFVHSYHVKCKNEADVLTWSSHGIDFVSCFQMDNIVGIQGHPEKSHKYGLSFFKKFISL